MTDYRKVEYRIGLDGQITEVVLNGEGAACRDLTQVVEQALGVVASQELLPTGEAGEEAIATLDYQSLKS